MLLKKGGKMRTVSLIFGFIVIFLINGCFCNEKSDKPEPVEEKEPSSCADIKCKDNSSCENDIWGGGCSGNVSLSCRCDDGFESTETSFDKFGNTFEHCVDIDECADGNICGYGRRCTNTEGSYYCEEIDECAENQGVCGPLDCLNTEISYKCECPSGNIFEFNRFVSLETLIEAVTVDDMHYTLYLSNNEIYDYSFDSSDPGALLSKPVLSATAYFDKGTVLGMVSYENNIFMICENGVYLIERESDGKLNIREEPLFLMNGTSAWAEDSGVLVMAGYDDESNDNALFFLDLTAGDIPSSLHTLQLNNADAVNVLGYRYNAAVLIGYLDDPGVSMNIKSMSGTSPEEFSLKSEIQIEPLDDDGWGGDLYENMAIEITEDKAFVIRSGYMDILKLADDGTLEHTYFMDSSILSDWIVEKDQLIQFRNYYEPPYKVFHWDITDPYDPQNFLTIDTDYSAAGVLKNNDVFFIREFTKTNGTGTKIVTDLEDDPVHTVFTEYSFTGYSSHAVSYSSGLTEIKLCSDFSETYYSDPVILENNGTLYIHNNTGIDIYGCDVEEFQVLEKNAFTVSERFAKEKDRLLIKSPDGIVVIYNGTGFGYYRLSEDRTQVEGMLKDGIEIGEGTVRSESEVVSAAILGNRLYLVDSNNVLTFGDFDNFDKTAVSIDIESNIFAPSEKGIYVKRGNAVYYYDTVFNKEPLRLDTIVDLKRIFAVNGYLVTQTSSSITVWVRSTDGSPVQVEEKIILSQIPDTANVYIAEAHVEGEAVFFSTIDGDIYKLSLPDCI
jgi:hypothetical protein